MVYIIFMSLVLSSKSKRDLQEQVTEIKQRLIRLEEAISAAEERGINRRKKPGRGGESQPGRTAPEMPRSGPLDQMKEVVAATEDLRVANGNLSADLVAKLYGISSSRLAGWLGRTRQAVAKTPDADSLQPSLMFFEHVARLRLVTENEEGFRKWLRMPNSSLGGKPPLDFMASGECQAIADLVDDILTGAPG